MLNKNSLKIRFQISSFKKIIFGICFLLFQISSNAQCAMCRASLESEGNTAKAQAVNDGIVYLMIIPYILVGIMGIIIYKMFVKKKEVVNE